MKQIKSKKLVNHTKYLEFQAKYGYIPRSDKNDLHKIKSRMLQGIYRKKKNEYSYCNYIESDDCYINFMRNEKLFNAATQEYVEITKRGRLTDKKRLRQNLLSSQPLAFNIFLPLKWDNYELATLIFKELFPIYEIQKITKIKLEYVPGDENGIYNRLITTDKSCFDIFIEFLNMKNTKSCFGVEVKYTENFSNTNFNKATGNKKKRYLDAISDFKQQFDQQFTEVYLNSTYNQLFRNQLITEEVKHKTDFKNCIQLVLFSTGDTKCVKAISGFKEIIKLKNSLVELTIEKILIKLIDNDKNKDRRDLFCQIYDRYCNYEKLQKYID